MRPGYWHGNGVMPALKQQHGLLGGIYVISDEHPIGYTHLYCQECRFDEVILEESPSYDKESKTLTAQEFELSYAACKDVTQFL